MPAKPKPTKQKKVKRVSEKSRRKILEKQLEAITKEIIFWRDGQNCVMFGRGKCGNGLMWNHLVAQKKSSWLRYDLGNVHVGCGVHNLEDFHGSTVFPAWFVDKFGKDAFIVLDHVRLEHIGVKRSVAELEELLAHYDELYQNRYTVELDLKSLIRAGYYGSIIQNVIAQVG